MTTRVLAVKSGRTAADGPVRPWLAGRAVCDWPWPCSGGHHHRCCCCCCCYRSFADAVAAVVDTAAAGDGD